MTALWNKALYSLVEIDRRFRGAYCLHITLTTKAVRTSECPSTLRRLHGRVSRKATATDFRVVLWCPEYDDATQKYMDSTNRPRSRIQPTSPCTGSFVYCIATVTGVQTTSSNTRHFPNTAVKFWGFTVDSNGIKPSTSVVNWALKIRQARKHWILC
jgi:hypothetical protein